MHHAPVILCYVILCYALIQVVNTPVRRKDTAVTITSGEQGVSVGKQSDLRRNRFKKV